MLVTLENVNSVLNENAVYGIYGQKDTLNLFNFIFFFFLAANIQMFSLGGNAYFIILLCRFLGSLYLLLSLYFLPHFTWA